MAVGLLGGAPAGSVRRRSMGAGARHRAAASTVDERRERRRRPSDCGRKRAPSSVCGFNWRGYGLPAPSVKVVSERLPKTSSTPRPRASAPGPSPCRSTSSSWSRRSPRTRATSPASARRRPRRCTSSGRSASASTSTACGARASTTGTSSTCGTHVDFEHFLHAWSKRVARAASCTSSAPSRTTSYLDAGYAAGRRARLRQGERRPVRGAPRALPRPRRGHPHARRGALAQPRERRRHRPLRGAARAGRAGEDLHGLSLVRWRARAGLTRTPRCR